MVGARVGRVLTFNCHEGYVHLLGKLGFELSIVDGLPGRYTPRWDTRMRPVPERARLVSLEEAKSRADYVAIIAHNVTDLIDVRSVDAPKILVLHVNLAARCLEEPAAPKAAAMSRQIGEYLELIGGIAVAVSEAKRESFGFDCPVIRPAVSAEEWSGYRGEEPTLLRVANQVSARHTRFGWDDHERVVGPLPFRLVGHNPDFPGVGPAADWEELRSLYRSHRAYVHTAGVGLDDGYNLSLLEAMASGMPVLSTVPSESPVVDGENGFLDRDPTRLHERAKELLADAELARRLGARARESVLDRFDVATFVRNWHRAIDLSQASWSARGSPTKLSVH
jgi:Glycosyl transferases group 1